MSLKDSSNSKVGDVESLAVLVVEASVEVAALVVVASQEAVVAVLVVVDIIIYSVTDLYAHSYEQKCS